MRFILLLIILLFVCCSIGYSQWFADFRCGYAAPIIKDANPIDNTLYKNHNAIYGYGDIFMGHNPATGIVQDLGENMPAYYVLNSGMNISFNFGYQLSKLLRISVNGFYLNSSILPYEKSVKNEYILTNSFVNTYTFFQHNSSSNGISFTQLSIDSKLQQFSPFIKIALFKKINNWDFSIYLNQGVSFYFIKKNIEILSHSYEYRAKQIIHEEYNKSFKYTGQCGVEVSYQLNNNIGVFTDLSLLYMNFTPDKAYITYRSVVNEQYDESNNIWVTNKNEFIEKEEITNVKIGENYDYRYRKNNIYKNNAINFSLGIRYYFNGTK